MNIELRAHRESYNLDVPFEMYIDREELLSNYKANRMHCWLEMSTLVRMMALLFDGQAEWSIKTLDHIVRDLEACPEYPGVTLSALPSMGGGAPRVVYDCVDYPLPCIVAGYDAVIERLKEKNDPFWQGVN